MFAIHKPKKDEIDTERQRPDVILAIDSAKWPAEYIYGNVRLIIILKRFHRFMSHAESCLNIKFQGFRKSYSYNITLTR